MSLSRPARSAGPGLPHRPMSTFPLGSRRVRRSGYGAMQLAGPWAVNAPPDRVSAIGELRAAVTAGIDHIDTAQYYGPDVVRLLQLAPDVLLIPGTGSTGHLRENLAAEHVALDDEAVRELATVGA